MKVEEGKSERRLPSRFRVSKDVTLWKTLFDITEMRLCEMSRKVRPVTSSKLLSSSSVKRLPDKSRTFRLKRYFIAVPGTVVKWLEPK